MQTFLEPYVQQAASAIDTVQVFLHPVDVWYWLRDPPSWDALSWLNRGSRCEHTRRVSGAARPTFDLARLSALPGINATTPGVVSDAIQVRTNTQARPISWSVSDSP